MRQSSERYSQLSGFCLAVIRQVSSSCQAEIRKIKLAVRYLSGSHLANVKQLSGRHQAVLSSSHQAVFRQSSCFRLSSRSHQAVVRLSSGSHKIVFRQQSGSCQALVMQLSGSHLAVGRQSCQAVNNMKNFEVQQLLQLTKTIFLFEMVPLVLYSEVVPLLPAQKK